MTQTLTGHRSAGGSRPPPYGRATDVTKKGQWRRWGEG
jgi:hypothetical protein